MYKTRLMLFIVCCLLILGGCQAALHNTVRNASALPEEAERQVVRESDVLAEYVKSIPYVHHATATIIGNSALVGIDLDDNFPDEKIPAIKREIREKILLYDSGLKRATVTITPHLLDKALGLRGDAGAPAEAAIDENLEESAVPAAPSP